MRDTHAIMMGHEGRIVVPAGVCARHAWREGTQLVAVDTASGLVLISRDAARAHLKEQLAGHDLVKHLLDGRRAEFADRTM